MSFTKYYAFDGATGLLKRNVAQAALTSTAYVGTQWDQGAAVSTDGICVINVESVDVAGGDEVYAFRVVGSNVADRSDGEVLAMLELGDAGALGVETVDTVVGGQYTIRFRTEKHRTKFRYIDLHLTHVGATSSIGFSAFFSKEI